MIRRLCCRHDQNNYETYVVVTSLKGLLYFHQKTDVTNNKYLKEFKARVKSIDDYNACILGKSCA